VGSLREREVAAVRELLDGRGRMLLLEGRAGIGKTSLIEVACARAAGLGGEVHAGGMTAMTGSRSGGTTAFSRISRRDPAARGRESGPLSLWHHPYQRDTA
jgi:hypothetical protein